MNEDIVELNKELYRYKTLYKILLEENNLLKENYRKLELQTSQQSINDNQDNTHKSIVYRGLRKIYHIVKKR